LGAGGRWFESSRPDHFQALLCNERATLANRRAFIMKVRDILKRLAEDGWIEVKGGKGSHRKFKHPTKPAT